MLSRKTQEQKEGAKESESECWGPVLPQMPREVIVQETNCLWFGIDQGGETLRNMENIEKYR